MFQRGSYNEVVFTEPLWCLKSSEKNRKCCGWTSVVGIPIWCFYLLGKWIICRDHPVADEISRESPSDWKEKSIPPLSSPWRLYLLTPASSILWQLHFLGNPSIKVILCYKYWLLAEIWLQILPTQTEEGPLMFVQCSSKEGKLPLGCNSTGSKLTAIKTIRV